MGETAPPEVEYVKLSTVTGYFLQDDLHTEPKGFDYSTTNFGLKDRKYNTDSDFDPKREKTQWQRFERQVDQLNHDGGSKTQYKLLFMGRHGEGYHNVAEAFYGTKAWDCYWSLQDGNSTSTWSDALLTPAGEAQAIKAHDFWSSQIAQQKIPTPQSYYASPLLRCLATASLTFSGLRLPEDRPFTPLIKEFFREANGAHTCDRRSSKSVIAAKFPTWNFEPGFEEEDVLWKADLRESNAAQDQRAHAVLTDVLSSDKNTWISISSHSGQIASSLRVLGHREFGLGTGQVIPILVKVEKVFGVKPRIEPAPWEKVEKCEKPPKRQPSTDEFAVA